MTETQFLVDLSDYDWARGPVDVASMRADGIAGLTHKATEGVAVVHRHLADALGRGRAAGVPVLGAYHVVRSGSVADQVRFFLSYLDAQIPWWRTQPGFFLQVDGEKWSYDQVSAGQIEAFTAALRAAEPDPVIVYASRGQYGDSLAGVQAPLWNANYDRLWSQSLGRCVPLPYRDAYIRSGADTGPGWVTYSGEHPGVGPRDVVFWQFTDNATVGSQPGCDVSAFRGSVSQLLALIGGSTDMQWSDPAMPQRLGNPSVFATADPVIADLFSVLNGRGSVYVTNTVVKPPLGAQIDRIEAAAVSAAKQVDALTAVVQHLTSSGTSIDTAAVLSAVKSVGDTDSAAMAAANGHITALAAELAAAHAELDRMRNAAQAGAQAQAQALGQQG